MNITVTKSALTCLAKRVQGVSDPKSSVITYWHVHLVAAHGKLFAYAGNRHMQIETFVPAQIATGGEVMIPTNLFVATVAKIKSNEVQLRVNERFMLTIDESDGVCQLKVPGIPSESIPRIPTSITKTTLRASDVAELIGCVKHAVSTDETRPHISHALFESNNGKLTMVATDGHRLAMDAVPAIPNTAWFAFYLNRRGLIELQRACSEFKSEIIEAMLTSKSVTFTLPETTLAIERTCFEFPPYQKVIPPSCSQYAVVKKKPLLAAIKATANTRRKEDALDLQLLDGKLCVNGSCGSSQIEATTAKPSPTILLCAKFFQEAVEAAPQDELQVQFSGEKSPVVISTSSYLALVMPMGR
jgi:DNA polymerase-3 subunit beta